MTLARQISRSAVGSQYFPFSGGLNIITPALSLEPGECIAADNFEVDIRGRYRRFDGYD